MILALKKYNYMRSEIFRALTTKIIVFWDVKSSSFVDR
jgi:hypothetical protein